MIIGLILAALLTIGIILMVKSTLEDLAVALIAIPGVLLLIHLLIVACIPLEYNAFRINGEIIQKTLDEARVIPKNLETATIARDVVEWNTALARDQYYNTLWLLECYVDDRVDSLKPIR